jgi:hypothetical protein
MTHRAQIASRPPQVPAGSKSLDAIEHGATMDGDGRACVQYKTLGDHSLPADVSGLTGAGKRLPTPPVSTESIVQYG